MTQVLTVPAVTAALIAQGTVTVITAAERGIDGRVLIRADLDEAARYSLPNPDGPGRIHQDRGGTVHVIHPGCIVASADVAWAPICIWRGGGSDEPLMQRGSPKGDELTYWAYGDGEYPDANFTDQLPYGDFTPGRWAGILTDVKATTDRCPAHWDEPKGMNSIACWACPGMVSPDRTCPPIPCDDVKEWP